MDARLKEWMIKLFLLVCLLFLYFCSHVHETLILWVSQPELYEAVGFSLHECVHEFPTNYLNYTVIQTNIRVKFYRIMFSAMKLGRVELFTDGSNPLWSLLSSH